MASELIKVHVVYENGVLRLLDPVNLEEGQEFVVEIPKKPLLEDDNEKHGRVFNMHAGKYWMSEDFDDELPDSFWLGEED